METARLSFVVLVIALANLATDITRLLLELVPPPTFHESVPVQPRPNQQEISVQPQGAQEPETIEKDIVPKKAKPLDAPGAPGARGPPHEPREAAPGRAPFSELPRDFSIKHPPWCLVCGQPMRRYAERRRFYQR